MWNSTVSGKVGSGPVQCQSRKVGLLQLLLCLLVYFSLPTAEGIGGESWEYSCRSQISSVDSTTDNLERAQREVDSAYEVSKDKKDEHESCLSYPDIYDYYEDGCRSQRHDAESARSNLESELDTFARRYRNLVSDVNSLAFSCGIRSESFGRSGTHTGSLCSEYKSLAASFGHAELVAICRSANDTSCLECLGITK